MSSSETNMATKEMATKEMATKEWIDSLFNPNT